MKITRTIPPADKYTGMVEILTDCGRTFQMLGNPTQAEPLLRAHIERVTKGN